MVSFLFRFVNMVRKASVGTILTKVCASLCFHQNHVMAYMFPEKGHMLSASQANGPLKWRPDPAKYYEATHYFSPKPWLVTIASMSNSNKRAGGIIKIVSCNWDPLI